MPSTGLDIRLAEPVVFLRGAGDATARRRNAAPPESAPAMVRGILTLSLAKATKVRSIAITLEGKAKTEWPEGIGARRAEVTEDVVVLSASTVFFRAGHDHGTAPTTSTRRAMSLGPGVALDHEADDEGALSDDDDYEDARREQSTVRGRRLSADHQFFQRHVVEHNDHTAIPTPPYTPRMDTHLSSVPGSPRQTLQELRSALRSEMSSARSPAPSRPPSFTTPTTTHSTPFRPTAPNEILSAPASQLPSTNVSSDASVHSSHQDISEHPSDEEPARLNLPRRPSPPRRQSSASLLDSPNPDSSKPHVNGDAGEQHPHSPPLTERQRSVSRSTVSQSPAIRPSRPSPSPAPPRPILHTSSSAFASAHNLSPGPNSHASSLHPTFPDSPQTSSPTRDRSESRVRGRQSTRFSLSAVSNVLHEIGHEITEITDRVRSKSRASTGPRPLGRGGAGNIRPEDKEQVAERQKERAHVAGEGSRDDGPRGRQKEREKTALEKFGLSLGLNNDGHGHGGSGEVDGEGDMWQEFRKGTYNFPISFSIPSSTPPTLRCDFGSIVYKLKAVVHRTGTFVPKLVANSEVTLISCPGEDDTEERDNIVVERQWDEQLRYVISISGKCFPIGGVVPITLVMMPLAKVRIYRITVLLEEKIDYYAHGRRVARHDPTRRYELMSLKHFNHTSKHHEKVGRLPLLPLMDDEDAKNSPLAGMVEPQNGEEEGDEMASLWNPNGPWTLQLQAHLPTCSGPVRFTCKHAKSNIMISHWIKIMIRVDRGEEETDKEKKRKQFDIIVETPVHLLSCKCNPDYTALPPYTFASSSQAQRSAVGPTPPGGCLCDHAKAEQRNRIQNQFTPMPAMPVQGLGYGAFNVPAAEFSNGLRRTSSGGAGNTSVPDRMMGGLATDHGQVPRPNAHLRGAGVPVGMGERPSVGRTAESSERLTTLVDRSLQFARLVSGEESASGDVPPAYKDAVDGAGEERGRVAFTEAAIAESRSGSQSRTHSRSRPASRPASRPGSRPASRPGSRPGSRPPSIMWP